MAISLFATLTLLLALSITEAAQAHPFPIRTIAKGAISGIQEPTQELIKDQAAWEKTWTRHATRVLEKRPEVDFSKEMVILVALGRKNTGGYTIEVTKVEPVGDKLQITVRRKSPTPGAMTVQMVTAPFQMVAVPQSDLAPEFVEAKAADAKTARPPRPTPQP